MVCALRGSGPTLGCYGTDPFITPRKKRLTSAAAARKLVYGERVGFSLSLRRVEISIFRLAGRERVSF